MPNPRLSKGSTNHIRKRTPKRLIVFYDGIGQSSSHGEGTVPTNVERLRRALKTPAMHEYNTEVRQIIKYLPGIGTDSPTPISGTLAAAFGLGLEDHVRRAYNFLVNSYEEGDELFLFGFSHGAFTARAIASFICTAGLLKRNYLMFQSCLWNEYKQCRRINKSPKAWEDWMKKERNQNFLNNACHPNVRIKILGVWDTVGSLGIPETWLSSALKITGIRRLANGLVNFHDTPLPAGSPYATIERAYQALALDEHRIPFSPTLLYNSESTDDPFITPTEVHNCWFPGVHTDIGGGYARACRDISDLTLTWMIDQIGDALAFKDNILTDLGTPSGNREKWQLWNIEPNSWGLSELHDSRKGRFRFSGSLYRTPGQCLHDHKNKNAQKQNHHCSIETIHPSVRLRMLRTANSDDKKVKPYRPLALAGFTLEKEVTSPNGVVSWSWVKTLEERNGRKKVIKIPEYVMKASLEPKLLDHAGQKTLRGRDADKKIDFVPRRLTSGQILRSCVPFGFPFLELL